MKEQRNWRARAACLGVDPATFHEKAWNDDKQRPGPELHVALGLCRTCSVRTECAADSQKEPLGVWGGLTPPERRGELPLKEAMKQMRANPAHATAEDFSQPRETVPGAPSVEEIDAAYKIAWETQAAAYGGYIYVPQDVAQRLSNEHAAAHRARYGDFETSLKDDPEPGPVCALEGCTLEPVEATGAFCSMTHRAYYRTGRTIGDAKAATVASAKQREPKSGLRTGTTCKNGHDLRGTLPNGKPVLHLPEGGRPVCRLCKLEAAQRHAEKTGKKKEGQ